jgi:hypothetical protein
VRRFAEARRKRGWTQKKLAQKIGLNQSEISTPVDGAQPAGYGYNSPMTKDRFWTRFGACAPVD